MLSCAEGTHCYGNACVQCYADAHCGCDGTCDTSKFECAASCKNNKDCLGNQHCRYLDEDTRQCAAGPSPSDVLCARPLTAGCSSHTGRSTPASPWVVGLMLLAGVPALRHTHGRRQSQRRARP